MNGSFPLRIRRLGIDTYRQPICYLRQDCPVCRSEGFEAQSRVKVDGPRESLVCTLNTVRDGLLEEDEIGLSEIGFHMLGLPEGALVRLSHPPTLESFGAVRAKIYGQRIDDDQMASIIGDIAGGWYSEVHLASFLTACAGNRLDRGEMIALTRCMVAAGERLRWHRAPVVDKHCVGGLPGNRTSPIVVAIVAAHGLVIPKTSSRAITSPAGTADVMETLTRVNLSTDEIRRVVDLENGCLAWGGGVKLSPVDDVLIRVEHPLDLDSEGQLVASVLSKKIAAGSTSVVIDVPVGPTAKVRTVEAAELLGAHLCAVGQALGLGVSVVRTDGTHPVGRGLGPALEAFDVMAVLRAEPDAPQDLRSRAIWLAGQVLELDPKVPQGTGEALARGIVDDGRAWRKLVAICEAQGGLREPPVAAHQREVVALRDATVQGFDNRRLSRIAKFAGAPLDKSAGLKLNVRPGERVVAGQPLYTIHAESQGELLYALDYAWRHPDVVQLVEGP